MSTLLNMLLGWEEVLVTSDVNRYSKAKRVLIDNGIKTRTETNHIGLGSGSGSFDPGGRNNLMYYLFVKRNEHRKANGLINS